MKSSRTAATRKQGERKPNYNPISSESELDLPPDIVESFEGQGYSLRWIRILINNGAEDIKNIGRRLRQGYTFVTFDELPEEYKQYYSSTKLSKFNSEVIAFGDVALAKIPTKFKVESQRRGEQRAIDQESAINRRLMQEGSSKVRTLMPIINESQTKAQSVTGQRTRTNFGATQASPQSDEEVDE